MTSIIETSIDGHIATITLNNASKLNALSQLQYFELAYHLNVIAQREDVSITVITARGRFFSAGADLAAAQESMPAPVSKDDPTSTSPEAIRNARHVLGSFVANNLYVTRAFYTHPKILVVALNGPVVGLTAAVVSFADFIFAAPGVFLLTPFSSLGLVAEGCASHALVRRLGRSKAMEALAQSKRITLEELVSVGFVTKVLDVKSSHSDGNSAAFDAEWKSLVEAELRERFGEHLNQESLTGIKKLVNNIDVTALDQQNVMEVFGGMDRLVRGIPQEEMRKIVAKEKKHKL